MDAADAADWAALRQALWPRSSVDQHATEIAGLLADPGRTLNLIARDDSGVLAGFAEASLRHDYVNGCKTSPVAFLEGIYVVPAFRRRGVASGLVAAVTAWGRAHGCRELASDTQPENGPSRRLHAALGFEETQQVVFFRKVIAEAAS